MYTELKSYQIIIELLKRYNIRHCVLSAGSRNVPFVHSVEEDPFFQCYSVVDERSAGYFALGLAQAQNEPVVISCTSSTAACNYYPPIAEAFYQRVPIVVLTSDRDPARLHQWEDQMIDQVGMYDRHVVKSVNLPIVKDKEDIVWCQRLVNEALLELNHNGGGPVHINIPMTVYNTAFTVKELPPVTRIERLGYETPQNQWEKYSEKLKKAKRILVTCGQKSYVSDSLKNAMMNFFESYNVAITADYMANMNIDCATNTSLCWDVRNISDRKFAEYVPDIVISYGGNIFQGVKELLTRQAGKFEHWRIQEDGRAVDMYKNISAIFECSPEYFFEYYSQNACVDNKNDYIYHNMVKECADAEILPEFEYCNVYAIKKLAEGIPAGSMLHLAINSAIRIANFSTLQPNVKVYANIGTHGIDGCLSSFLGQAVWQDKLSFLIIGDLSFFYDMNAMRIRHVSRYARILLINNHGGEEFYYNGQYQNEKSDLHTTARHTTKAEGWVKETGFKYLTAVDKTSFDKALVEFLNADSEQPILLEVITEMSHDARILHEFYDKNKDAADIVTQRGKEFIKSVIGQEKARQIKNMLKK